MMTGLCAALRPIKCTIKRIPREPSDLYTDLFNSFLTRIFQLLYSLPPPPRLFRKLSPFSPSPSLVEDIFLIPDTNVPHSHSGEVMRGMRNIRYWRNKDFNTSQSIEADFQSKHRNWVFFCVPMLLHVFFKCHHRDSFAHTWIESWSKDFWRLIYSIINNIIKIYIVYSL